METMIQQVERVGYETGQRFVRAEPRLVRNERDGTIDVTLALVRGENGSENESIEFARAKDNPEKQLEIAAGYFEDSAREIAAKRELPGTAMAFVNLKKTAISYDKRAAAGGRTAGYMNVRRPSNPAPVSYTPAPITPETLPHRDPVTRMELSPLPPETGF